LRERAFNIVEPAGALVQGDFHRRRLDLEQDRFKRDHAPGFFAEGDSRFRLARPREPQTIAL